MSKDTPAGLFLPKRSAAALERKRLSKVIALACILGVIYGEAKGEPEIGRQAVAHVILNSAKAQTRPPCAIVNAPRQFYRVTPPSNFTIKLADTDPTGGALYFKNYPGKWGNKRFIKRIGGHYFYE